MDREKIEQAAITAIKSYFSFIDTIKTNLSENDKTISLDGNLERFSKEINKQNSKENQIYQINVQVKGTTRELTNNKYPVSTSDLKYYFRNGFPLIYFVVKIDKTNQSTKILYKELRLTKIKQIIDNLKPKAKTISLSFQEIPNNKSEFVNIMDTFNVNVHKQSKYLLETHHKTLNNNNFKISAYIRSNPDLIEQQLKDSDVDFYRDITDKDTGETFKIPYAIGSLTKVGEYKRFSLIDYQNRHQDVTIFKPTDSSDIFIRLNTQSTIEFKILIKNDSTQRILFNLKLKGTIENRLNDLIFLYSILTEEVKIVSDNKNYGKIPKGFFQKQNFEKVINQIVPIKNSLEKYYYFLKKISIMTNFDPDKDKNKLGQKTLNDLFRLEQGQIQSSTEPERIEIHLDENIYQFLIDNNHIFNVLSKNFMNEIEISIKDGDESLKVNPYTLVTGNFDKYPNFKNKFVINSFKNERFYNEELINYYLSYSNELLKNYDSSKMKELLQISRIINQKLFQFSKNYDLLKINLLQIKLRQHKKNKKKDLSFLMNILENSSDNYLKLFSSILLNLPEEEEKYLRSFSEDEITALKELPIFNIYKYI
ncbi:DUF4365 domain-containing protein [Companilactobacillus farciminis]|uniref:DUF4365 domain-containing protein n=1 Tax=Companilactobacillus farciminis TaxID=1612 RepID=UPI00232DA08E|nr:DUF4365 domain-containing protein [Companilactobacillus farciminis]WCG36031.1 DUF4365 domain-containing protein [Companilactobacillus farciminis]